MNVPAAETVVLLHGLWLRGGAMAYLQRRLHGDGFRALAFDYSSVHEDVDTAGARLRDCVRAIEGRVHLLGHSLGGMLAATTVQRWPELIAGRVVCIGAPLCGSVASRSLRRWPGGEHLLGRSRELLEHGLPRWDAAPALGVIAGRLPLGLGVLLGGLQLPHDGTVAVAETRLPGLADHRVVAASHAGLLFSDEAARQAGAFLRDGRFAA